MLLPKEGGAWRAAPAIAPIAGGSRTSAHYVTKTGLAIAAVFIGVFLLVCHGVNMTIRQMDRFYCWGPAAGPMDMTVNEHARWVAHLQTPVLFNHHIPVEVNSSTIRHVNLNTRDSLSGDEDQEEKERVLILTPLRDAANHLEHYFDLLALLSYPHHLIDLAFLVGDSTDDTLAILAKELERVQTGDLAPAFRSATIVEKGFGFALSQEVKDRHSYAAQAPRRKMMAKARNYLLSVAMKPEHAWVFWRDVDIEESPSTIIEDLIKHDRDVIVPNIWFHRYEMQRGRMTDIEGRFDYNSWQETPQSLKLTSRLGKDVILAEGYKEYTTGRKYMATLGDWRADPDEEMPLDGIGGVSIMVRADVHRSGINFPSYAFENQAETEGFAKMAKRAGYGVYGLPNYIVWHVDTKEEPGNA